ncbi:hypothetical protein TSOC_008653 [Tetrabaena socialis]|uniref:CxC3 like cysteine cluster domain-containing protein n=1 Tax=Tetrabaena socialis TaxID=47790 RepID=A0A2J7ZXX3_9CHLO|nr:hypothetical protein TSOC_008653 [Tetrabaena socialis]|eukprot:PNH05116.1 hypothetical protein TSOC_008653 [Tetrabaena socialis]
MSFRGSYCWKAPKFIDSSLGRGRGRGRAPAAPREREATGATGVPGPAAAEHAEDEWDAAPWGGGDDMAPPHGEGNDSDSGSDGSSDSSSSSDGEPSGARSFDYDSPEVSRSFFEHLADAADIRGGMLAALSGWMRGAVETCAARATCPRCRSGNAVSDCLEARKVTVVCCYQPVTIDVPQLVCSNPQCGLVFSIKPTSLDCLPDTAVAWDVCRWRHGITVLWWHCPLLQHFTGLQYFTRHLGMESYCASMLADWELNGVSTDLTLVQLRQRLSKVTQMYRYLRGLVEDYAESLKGWPAGAVNACPCCGDAVTVPGPDVGNGRGAGGFADGAGAHTDGGGSGVDGAGGGLGAGGSSDGGVDGADGGRGVGSTADGAGAHTGGSGGGGGGGGVDGGRGVGGTVNGAGAHTGGGGGVGDRLPWGVEHQSGTENAGRGPFSLHSVHFDGCFKLNQIKRKSRCKHPDSTSVVGNVQYTRNYTQLSRRRYTIRNDLVEALEASGSGSADIGRNTDCSNFTADKVLAQESVKNLITAAGVVVCRHGMLFRLLSFFHGERHLYSTAAAQSFFCVGTAVQFWWYDIACRWSKSFQKWLQRQDGADVALKEKGKDMVCLIPPWHSHAHSYDCQKAFGHLGQAGAGRGTGEVAEIFNSQVGPHGKTLRYMSPVHRESVLEDVGRRYCRQVELGLPARVQRMQFRAKAALEAAGQRVAAMEAGLGPDKVSCCVGAVAWMLRW